MIRMRLSSSMPESCRTSREIHMGIFADYDQRVQQGRSRCGEGREVPKPIVSRADANGRSEWLRPSAKSGSVQRCGAGEGQGDAAAGGGGAAGAAIGALVDVFGAGFFAAGFFFAGAATGFFGGGGATSSSATTGLGDNCGKVPVVCTASTGTVSGL